MSLITRLRQAKQQSATPDDADPEAPEAPGEPEQPGETDAAGDAEGPVAGPGRLRVALRWTVTGAAAVLVLSALLLPNRLGRLHPSAFARIPVEAIAGAVVLLVLRPAPRRVAAVVAGAGLGLLTVVKLLDMGFYEVLNRPFDLVLDWVLFDDAYGFLVDSLGRAGAIAAAVGLVLLVLAVLAGMALAVLRLTRLLVRHETATARGAGVAAVAWIACAALGAQLVPGLPVAARTTTGLLKNRVHQVSAGLRDQRAFAAQADRDDFRDVPADRLLSALRGKDVLVTFVESYGRVAFTDPHLAAQVDPVLADGTHRLAAAGFDARSAFLTSPTFGGGSWLAHSTFLSGLWINNQQRYRTLVSSDRLTLTAAFRRADWQTVGVMPGVVRAWPESRFYGIDKVYDSRNLGYAGPKFSWAPMPDQFSLRRFQALEHGPTHAPIMAEIHLVSSHLPWAPLPRTLDWDALGDGSRYAEIAEEGQPKSVIWQDPAAVRTEYGRSLQYCLETLVSWVERYGDDNIVLVFLGDHQPSPIVSGDGASHDVPITIVTRDQAVLDRIAGWNWQPGLKPGPGAPVWPMNAFRDRFLNAFTPTPDPTH
ncbi:alkaline phosphatase family protein [Rhizomonospora bruguierae]|uniref:sulfatase n=1 Tax=Rhizomonospora bruguierae TaxID=1581705 RepID=UPI0020BF3FD2|nr:sulfatase [Micromonospora sp. NBRC 107566]